MDYLPEALYSAADTREADRRAAQYDGLDDGELMERAGAAAFQVLRERFPRSRRVAVVCGPGNNGGDGYVVARLAREAGLAVEVLSPVNPDRLAGDARQAYERWHHAAGLTAHNDFSRLSACDAIVDAMFGTGLERPLEAEWKSAVEAINATGVSVLALDMPSGLHADTGRVLGKAVRADVTLAFVGLKPGLFTGQGREYSGTILFDDLGTPENALDGLQPVARRLTVRNLRGLLASRLRHAHKGDAGRALVIGGQPGMPGAVQLAGEAAYRAGAGLVRLATHADHAIMLGVVRPELIAHGIAAGLSLASQAGGVHAVAVGPGIGLDAWGRELSFAAFGLEQPLVVDADALRHLASQPRQRDNWVLTPHPGEAAALLDITSEDVQFDRIRIAKAIGKRFGGVCVLKGSGTIIADATGSSLWLCDRGGPGLATAGTGDVLTGIIVALLAQGLSPMDAARTGVWVHAVAGEYASQDGERGVVAGDLLDHVRHVVNVLCHDH